ncbi:MAG: hypothetical protein J5494_08205 [Candidatus Methanomethylophilaceae archaeon]|nr:hypothetical protein [Candidatus Methanomethylophilaceae archaeon]
MALFGRGKTAANPPALRESDCSAETVSRDFRTVFAKENTNDLVRLSDGYAWIYPDGSRTMLYCANGEWICSREADIEERMDLELSGPGLVKMLARDALELSAVNSGMDLDADPGFRLEFSRISRADPDKARGVVTIGFKNTKQTVPVRVPAFSFDAVYGFISGNIR